MRQSKDVILCFIKISAASTGSPDGGYKLREFRWVLLIAFRSQEVLNHNFLYHSQQIPAFHTNQGMQDDHCF